MKLLQGIAAGAMALACVAPHSASADVLQISDGGFEWIAGGPAPEMPAIAETGVAETLDDGLVGVAPVDGALHPQSFTQALDAAGPARWREHVAAMAAKYDISPTLLEAVVWQESRWNEGAVSPVGARGLAQLMPGTARQMGVNPADPRSNLEGGARYLRMQLDAFGGNIEKALAAYNAGPARVIRAGGIPAIRETQQYVAAIMSRLTEPVRK